MYGVTTAMDDWGNIVDEKHDSFLKDFCHISEVSDIAKSENPKDFVSRY
jgi:hypothetical protein